MEKVKDKVSMITPVPLGVGSVTSTILAQNVLKSHFKIHNIR
jgi:5,10-methylene-tetrahydrofolate dehydrogenase/methenyl tetrahydrofolate cyclohydrolase